MDRVLGKGNADGISNPVVQQGPDSDRGLDAAILAVPRLGDSEVDGIIPVRAMFLKAGNEETVGLRS